MSTIVSVVSKRTCHEIPGGHDINWLFFRVPLFGHERAVMILSYDANLGRMEFSKGTALLGYNAGKPEGIHLKIGRRYARAEASKWFWEP